MGIALFVWAKCVICGKPFKRNNKGDIRGNTRTARGVRRKSCITCSPKCSKINIRNQTGRKNRRIKEKKMRAEKRSQAGETGETEDTEDSNSKK